MPMTDNQSKPKKKLGGGQARLKQAQKKGVNKDGKLEMYVRIGKLGGRGNTKAKRNNAV